MDLPPDIERQLADMSESDCDILVSRLRAPDTAEAFREAASKYIDGDRLEAVCRVANITMQVDDDGNIDASKVERSMRAVFGLPAQPRWADHGQYTPPPPVPGPGERGNAEARKRFHGDGPLASSGRGVGGRETAEKRFGRREQQ